MSEIKKIAVIGGDGIGPEVVAEGIKVLKEFESVKNDIRFSFDYYPWGCDYYKKTGKMMDDDGLEKLKEYDAVFLGAVGDPSVSDHISLWELLLKIRKGFDQYINLRPAKLLKGVKSPIRSDKDIDMIFIRENSEGEYSGEGCIENEGTDEETVKQVSVFTKKGVSRVIRYAYEVARREGKTLTSITKSNALNYSMVYWDRMFAEIGKEYPEVKTYKYHVDAASMFMVMQPERFQVVVASNLFGDILTDLAAAITGGLGLASGANINPEREFPSMFEPVHGSAPDIAGTGNANPIAAIWSASQLLEHLGYKKEADIVLDAIQNVIVEGKVLTVDMGGKSTTSEVGDRVVTEIRELTK